MWYIKDKIFIYYILMVLNYSIHQKIIIYKLIYVN